MRIRSALRYWCSTLLLLQSFASLAQAATDLNSDRESDDSSVAEITLGSYHEIHSRKLDDTRRYSLFLPQDYDAAKQYPVIYLLDGDNHFRKLIGVIEGMTDGILPSMPDVIVVGLGNRDRMRDYTPTHTLLLPNGEPGAKAYARTGGGGLFLDFIEQELMPAIDRRYSTSGLNILVGHSFGGLLTLEALRRDHNSFNAFVAIDPSLWFDYPAYDQTLKQQLGADKGSKGALFLAAADNPFTPGIGLSSMHRDLIRELGDQLEAGSSPEFTALTRFYPGSDHSSVVLPSIVDSLQWLFQGYRIPFGAEGLDAARVIENYDRLSTRLGSKIKPERADLQFQWSYIEHRVAEKDRTPLFKELLEHYYPDLPVEPQGRMAH